MRDCHPPPNPQTIAKKNGLEGLVKCCWVNFLIGPDTSQVQTWGEEGTAFLKEKAAKPALHKPSKKL